MFLKPICYFLSQQLNSLFQQLRISVAHETCFSNETEVEVIGFIQSKAVSFSLTIYHIAIHQMVNTEIRLIIFFVAKNGEALYSQQKMTGS